MSENLHRNNAAEWVMWCVIRPVQFTAYVVITSARTIKKRLSTNGHECTRINADTSRMARR
jgi:hypothetical protein